MGRPARAVALLVALWAACGGATAADTTGTPPGPEPALAEQLQRSRILLHRALDDALPQGLSVVEVETGYLAGQGLLVIADLVSWYRRQGGALDLDDGITRLEQIPDMVHDILRELDLGLSRHQVDDLQALRGLRDEQQAVRAERRALRGELRELRRRRTAADADGAAAEVARLDGELTALEARLEAAAERERRLEREAERKRGAVAAPRI